MATSPFEASPSTPTRCSPTSSRSSRDALLLVLLLGATLATAVGCKPRDEPLARDDKPTPTELDEDEAAAALPIEIVARRWTWTFVYPDGRRTAELVVPAGRPLALTLTSEDVLHRFAVPELGLAEDVVPGADGRKIKLALDETGRFAIACAEYCGENHKSMRAELVVETPEAYETWLSATAPAAADARPAHADRGQVIFQLNGCANCHRNVDKAPPLTGRFGQEVTLADGSTVTFDAAYVRESLLDPDARKAAGDWPEPMPAYAGKLGKREIDWLIDHLAAQ